jgi:tRNA(Ile2) C34 agmatinyltransferase TiaS
MTMDQVAELGHEGYAHLRDEAAADQAYTSEGRAVRVTALAMLARGDKRYARGPLIAAQPSLLVLGAAFLVPGFVMAVARQVMRIRHFRNITIAESGRCPRCSYSLKGLGMESICPECGLDILTTVRRSRGELGHAHELG